MSERKGTRTGGRAATGAVIPGRWALSIGRPRLPEPEGFKWTLLGDLARLESGHTPSRGNPDYWDGGVPWIGIRDATAQHGERINDTFQHITESGLVNSSARLLPVGTVCLSRTASVGYVLEMGIPMATSQDFVNWVCGADLLPSYLRYLLVSEQDSVRRFAYGTTHQTMYFPEAKALHVLVPPLPEQQAIAEVLGALDDKIAANARLSETSARLAHLLFASSLSEGSETALLADLCELISRGITPAYVEEEASSMVVLNQKCIREQRVDLAPSRRTSLEKTREAKVLRAEDVLINSTGQGTLGRAARWTESTPATVDSHITIVRFDPAQAEPTCGGFALLSMQRLIEEMGEGSTGQTELSRVELGKMPVRLPAIRRMQSLGAELRVFAKTESAVLQENRTLAATRDALLPQLMSGKLRVREAEQLASEVL